MKTLGILGGMSAESTVSYYLDINRSVNKALGGNASAKILISSVNFGEIVQCQKQGNWQAAAEILAAQASLLEQAGAEGVILGCTEIGLLINQNDSPLPFFRYSSITQPNGCGVYFRRRGMYKLNKDFNFLSSIISSFFKQRHIIKRLNEIDEHEIYGWEIWLQVEMLLYFRKLDQISEVYREEPCAMDRRKTYKTKCAIDLIIRQKRARSFIPLEIKQSWYAPRCINQMLRDIEKYECIKSRDLPTERAIWCMGIHKKPINQKHIDNKLSEYYPKLVCEPIKGTDYMYTLF